MLADRDRSVEQSPDKRTRAGRSLERRFTFDTFDLARTSILPDVVDNFYYVSA